MAEEILIKVHSSLTEEEAEAACGPKELADKITQSLFIKYVKEVMSGFYIGESPPPPSNISPIWIKTSSPKGIAFKSGGHWTIVESPVSGLISIWNKESGNIPDSYEEVSSEELSNLGITPISDKAIYIKYVQQKVKY